MDLFLYRTAPNCLVEKACMLNVSSKDVCSLCTDFCAVVCSGAASIGKGIGGMLFSRFSRSSSQPSGVDSAAVEGEEKSQSAYGLSTMSQSASTIIDTAGVHTRIIPAPHL